MHRGYGDRSCGAAVKAGFRRVGIASALGLVVVASLGVASLAVAAGPSSERAIARTINLRASDVPSFHLTMAGLTRTCWSRCCHGLEAVFGRRDAVNARSPLFTRSFGRQEELVYSRVGIERSRDIAVRDVLFAQTGRARACLTRALEAFSLSQPGVRIRFSRVRVTRLPVNATGTDGGFGIRIRFAISAQPRIVPETAETHVIGFAVGRDEITLFASRALFASRPVAGPFPHRTEQRLASLLVSRALASPH